MISPLPSHLLPSHYRGPWQATVALAPLRLPVEVERVLREAAGRAPYPWPHVTLVQLPDRAQLDRVRSGLAAVSGQKAFSLEVEGVGAFAEQGVVYLRLRKTPDLLDLQVRAAAVVGDAAAIYTGGRWLPHISVFYDVADPEEVAARLKTVRLEATLPAEGLVLRDWLGPDTVYPLARRAP